MSILPRLGWSHEKAEAYKAIRCDNHEGTYIGQLFTRSGVPGPKVGIVSGQEDVTKDGRRCRVLVKTDTGQLQTVSQEQLLKSALAVWERTYVPDYGDCDVPVHWGPIMQADPGPTTIGLTARGVGELAGNNLLSSKTLLKGHVVTTAIRTVLHDWAGLRNEILDIPSLNHTLPASHTYPRGGSQKCLAIAAHLAASVGYDLDPDGQGHVWMHQPQATSVFDFYDAGLAARLGQPISVLTAPVRSQTIRDSSGNLIPNWVQVHGYRPPKKGPGSQQPAVDAEWFADPESIISKEELALNNGERVVLHGILHEYTNTHIKDQGNALGKAKQLIAGFEQISQGVTFDARILPFFDFNDFVTVHTGAVVGAPGFLSAFNLRDFSFSFGGEDDTPVMSIGETRPLSLAGTKIRPAR